MSKFMDKFLKSTFKIEYEYCSYSIWTNCEAFGSDVSLWDTEVQLIKKKFFGSDVTIFHQFWWPPSPSPQCVDIIFEWPPIELSGNFNKQAGSGPARWLYLIQNGEENKVQSWGIVKGKCQIFVCMRFLDFWDSYLRDSHNLKSFPTKNENVDHPLQLHCRCMQPPKIKCKK